MKTRVAMGVIALAIALAAQPRGITWRSVWFEDGTALDFYTQATGSTTPVSASGSMMADIFSGMHRVVVDKDGRLLFIYGVDAWRDALPQTFFVRIKPVDPDLEQNRASNMPHLFSKATHPFPTVAAVRDFPGVRLGDAIVLDILQNPATGEKISDVISPIETAAARAVAADEFHLDGPRVVVNGQTMTVAGSGTAAGTGLALRLPAKGTFYLSTEPNARYGFQPAGRVDRDRLTVTLGDDRLEIAGSGNILKKSAQHTIWGYREAGPDRQYTALEQRVQMLRVSLEMMRRTYTENHPEVVAARKNIAAFEERRDQMKKTVVLEGGTVEALIGGRK